MLRATAFFILLSGAATLSAQLGPQAATPAPRTWTLPPMTLNNTNVSACPVQLRAQHKAGGDAAIPVGDSHAPSPRPEGPVQHLRLVLSDNIAPNAVSASVKVRGLSGKSRAVLTPANRTLAADRVRTVQAVFTASSPTETTADLVLPGFSAVLSVQIVSLTYKDGTTWTAPGAQTCRVAPDPLLPVAGN